MRAISGSLAELRGLVNCYSSGGINQARISGFVVGEDEIAASPEHTGRAHLVYLESRGGARKVIDYSGYFCFGGEALAGAGASVVAGGGGAGVSSFFTESGSSLA